MRSSRRLKRMSRNRGKISKMNLTSLMDVFTILVFFLLVNSGSVEILDAPKEVQLPESQVETKPRETVVIFVSPEEILVQGVPAGLVADVLTGDQLPLDNIRGRLQQLSDKVIGTSTMTVAATKEVTILADKSVPFTVVRQIMSTCTSAGYENVSLAVVQKGAPQVANL
jgi:biopolymer transport protein ExbD